ncbi:hypothetical protein [Methylosinus sp. Sm6]|uniref:hypothetical protein n=1 Tax=Methylosinus sp. Sm6 TaxID=2866948 RepID=UPI002102045E|nr:hypothetical protein [Methylosinus sp. Sm6]
MPDPAADAFFAAWRTYRKIVDTNYMYHREIGERIEETLRAAFGNCGLARFARPHVE